MLLPQNFKSVIADTFYDKDVSVLSKTTSTTDGWVDESASTVTSTFKANVQFNNLEKVQSELGLTSNIDVVLTCSTDAPIAVDDLFSYDGVTYKASAAVPRDSHLKVAGSRWV